MGTAAVTERRGASANPKWKPTGEAAKDVQGIIVSAYRKHVFAMIVMVRFPVPPIVGANRWIAQLAPRITDATRGRDVCLNLALSKPGLTALGVTPDVIATFSAPFQEGMTAEHRSHFLGDDSSGWKWSDCGDNPNGVHALLMIYARTQAELDPAVAAEIKTINDAGLSVAGQIPLRVNVGPHGMRREHFGFADGISQPILVEGGIPLEKLGLHEIPAGEVVLGEHNTYDIPAAGPIVPTSPDAAQYLQPAAMQGFLDLGRNGSYIVVRQLKQDVAKFWNNMKSAADGLLDENQKPASDEWLAQKAVGRTLDGDVLSPLGPVGGNDMKFFASDPHGFGCPITSHVRRANPRDGLAPTAKDTQDMIKATNRHRILRRGRVYGEEIADRYVDDGKDRGLVFICLNSEIERQFEFVQHTWLLNPMFGLGFNESDPILGSKCPYSIPSKPVRQQPVLETFITPVGGGYFFLPSLRALHYLGALR